ncbi:MAG: glycoside hydrolase family 28 protein [Opitutaceae bacterium]|nr:glycoside hydrolase family 28 protein [Opitutaceae bacterium]
MMWWAGGAAALAGTVRDIRDYGAVGDGVTLNTVAINQAVAEAARAGGGTVVVPAGRFLTGTVYLQSCVTLRLDDGAELLGSTNLADYPLNAAPPVEDTPAFARIRHIYPANLEYGRYSLVYAEDQHDIAVVGRGRINGQGDHPNFSKAELKRRGMAPREAHLTRPYGLSFVRCRNVQVRDITFVEAAFWCQDYLDCDGVLIDGITVDSRRLDANNDGIDIDGSRRVRISNCEINSGDDSICLKASYRDCEDVVITNSTLSSLANGVKFGTASNAGFRNVAISNLVMRDVAAAGLALEIVDGGTMDGVTITNIAMERVGAPLFIRLGDRGRNWMRAEDQPSVGALRNISISNVTASVFTPYDARPLGASITGLPGHPVENISINGLRVVTVRAQGMEAFWSLDLDQVGAHAGDYPEYSMFGALPAYGLFIRDARGVTLRDVELDFVEPDHRSALVCDRVSGVRVDGLRAATAPGAAPVVRLRGVSDALLGGAVAAASTEVFASIEGGSSRIVLGGNDLSRARRPVVLAAELAPATVENRDAPASH